MYIGFQGDISAAPFFKEVFTLYDISKEKKTGLGKTGWLIQGSKARDDDERFL